MAYFVLIQFEHWAAQDVADWLKGLDDTIQPYIQNFIMEGIDGKKLLMLTHSDLEKLGLNKLGHQELIMEAVDLLKSLRYMFETENLQHLALQLGCKAKSLHNEILALNGENDPNRANILPSKHRRQLSVSVLSSICDITTTLKLLTSWLDRPPFEAIYDINLLRNSIVKLGLELVVIAQKESGITDIENAIVKTTTGMTGFCDELVLNIQESLIVQPASLEIANIRKKQGDELGMNILSSYGIHVIDCIKDMSPADLCNKIEKGDEVLQVNNQTVLGWQLAKLVAALRQWPKEVTMLLKKRPRHSTPFGITPNRRPMNNKHHPAIATLPKQKSRRSRDGEKAVRPTLQEYVTSSAPSGDIFITRESPEDNNDDNDTDNDVFRSGSESPQFSLPVTVDGKQRRATVSGGSPTFERTSLVVDEFASLPVRPKSQAINNMAEKDAAIAALLAPDSSLQRRASNPDKLLLMINKPKAEDTPLKEDTENGAVLDVETPTPSEDMTDTQPDLAGGAASAAKEEEGEEDRSGNRTSEEKTPVEEKTPIDEKTLVEEIPAVEERPSKVQEFTVTKPKPLMSESSSSPKSLCRKYHKIAKSEVAGKDRRSDVPMLVRIKRLDSTEMDIKQEDDEVFVKPAAPSKQVGFQDEATGGPKLESFAHIIVGNVVHKIPMDATGDMQQPVKMRSKLHNRKKIDRRISCKDLGKGDCEGWLYKRRQKDRRTLSRQWAKRWCVLKASNLFYFDNKDDQKAEGVIHLPAFQVSPSPNLKTKKFDHGAFKIHNAGTSFFFAAERQDDMTKWMNKMGLAAINYSPEKVPKRVASPAEDADFSESDSCSDASSQQSPLVQRRQQGDSRDGLNSSTDELQDLLETIQQQDLTIDGKSKMDQRKSQCQPSMYLLGQADPKEMEKLKQLQSMQRTLKAKEQELKDIEMLMTKPQVTSTELSSYLDKHKDSGAGAV